MAESTEARVLYDRHYELLNTLLDMLRFFQRDAHVIFQLAPRGTSNRDAAMVGELIDALKALGGYPVD